MLSIAHQGLATLLLVGVVPFQKVYKEEHPLVMRKI